AGCGELLAQGGGDGFDGVLDFVRAGHDAFDAGGGLVGLSCAGRGAFDGFGDCVQGALPGSADVFEQTGDVACGGGCAVGEFAHFVGNDGEAAALFSGAGGFDCRIEGEQVGLGGDVADEPDHFGNPGAAFAQLVHTGRGAADAAFDVAHAVD